MYIMITSYMFGIDGLIHAKFFFTTVVELIA